jgi:hypothetical protein
LRRANSFVRACLDSSAHRTEVIALYSTDGYQEPPAFNNNPDADYSFEKWLNSKDHALDAPMNPSRWARSG